MGVWLFEGAIQVETWILELRATDKHWTACMDPSRSPGVVCRGYAKLCRTSPVMDNGNREYNETV